MGCEQAGFVIDADGRHVKVTAARLRGISLFAAADDAGLVALADHFEAQRYDAGNVIVREGDSGDTFYLIVRGEVAVAAVRDGAEIGLAVLEDGDLFGEIALLS